MAMGIAWNYITGNNNGPGKIDPSGFGSRGHALMKTADTTHSEPTVQGGADQLNHHPATHDTFNRTQADQFETDAQWKTAQRLFNR